MPTWGGESSCRHPTAAAASSPRVAGGLLPHQVNKGQGWRIKELMGQEELVCLGEQLEEGQILRRGAVFGGCCTLKGSEGCVSPLVPLA